MYSYYIISEIRFLMRILFLGILTILLFTACSNKKELLPNKDIVELQNNNISENEEDFDDEFSNEEEDLDPLKYYNQAMTQFNDVLYTYALSPAANTYTDVIHKEVRGIVSNFFSNLMFPIRFVNNVLQFKFQEAGEETGRFLINSTIGFFGLFDPASEGFDLNEHKEDFGQTLGYWGIGSGFHIVLPVFGPSNLRDLIGFSIDGILDPTFSLQKKSWKIPDNLEKSLGLKTLETINSTSFQLGQYENIKKDAIDLYPFLKEIYEQKRKHEIKE